MGRDILLEMLLTPYKAALQAQGVKFTIVFCLQWKMGCFELSVCIQPCPNAGVELCNGMLLVSGA